MFLIDALLCHNILSTTALDSKERSSFRGLLFRISEGYFFGPHHLIMAVLLYFEEKVHKKKLQRADAIPLLFPRLLCQILEHWGIHQILSWSASVYARGIYSRQVDQYDSSPSSYSSLIRALYFSEPRMAIPISEYRDLSHIADPDRVSEQPCSGDGSYSSSPGQMLTTQASAHCHLEAAPASSRSSISC
ncbi:hypothetical protein CK203_087649 [Vitis vinifera]|uniref:Uncharacterized protein n=1 Tax=Vitis vinifera TaxID=29760 RepID=A0A438C750_VITVI|nr:hypothetical protein CK203_087649 [Vitis vinifera]